jgi:hypothetical protein
MAERPTILDLGDLGLERGAQVLLKRALRSLPVGGRLVIRGASRELEAHLSAWCRMQGQFVWSRREDLRFVLFADGARI